MPLYLSACLIFSDLPFAWAALEPDKFVELWFSRRGYTARAVRIYAVAALAITLPAEFLPYGFRLFFAGDGGRTFLYALATALAVFAGFVMLASLALRGRRRRRAGESNRDSSPQPPAAGAGG